MEILYDIEILYLKVVILYYGRNLQLPLYNIFQSVLYQ